MIPLGFLVLGGCNFNQPAQPPPQPPTQLLAANDALKNHQSDGAIAEAQAFLHDNPTGPLAAQALYIEGRGYEDKVAGGPDEMNRNLSEAHACYLLALQQSPSTALEGDIDTSLANVEFFQDQFADCIQHATTAMSLITDNAMKGNLLFRIGACQQRLQEFSQADQTFRQVQQHYPNTKIAIAAKERIGQTKFYVQVATFATQDLADRATDALKKDGIVVSERNDGKGHVIVDDGPFPTYHEAKAARDGMLREFPDAMVIP